MDGPETVSYQNYGPEKVDTFKHRQLAREAAEQGIVLLKNDRVGAKPLLPLSHIKDDQPKKQIAFIGPHANATLAMLSNYFGTSTIVEEQSPYQVVYPSAF